ncbi:MAG: undecaprenyldiphospho-muramoylpentapeptide beta-N-acetylglucosaminyltransferase [Paracoccaceae bacterium]|nr:undecaprenyldiphospho-muramoylpentapeptide beta-N-acetylglucosaminyltransferase [Paracoccaceae bacterium]
MSKPLLVIAAGGTGGHMFPAQALAEEMLKRGWRVRLSTDERGAHYAGAFPDEVERQVVSAGTFARGGLSRLAAPFQILAGAVTAVLRMARERPACVAGFGGYPAFPAMTAAWILRRPRLIHEANGVLGRVNELFARRVDRVACGIWPTELPSGAEAVHTGNPVRASILEVVGAPYPPEGEAPNLLIFGGSQGASILSRVAPAAVALLPEALRARLTVAHQARPTDHDAASVVYDEAGVKAEILPFFDDMPQRLTRADLVIARSGASSVADIAVVGRPSILIPLAIAKRDEQTANARGLVEAGAAVMMPERDLNPGALAAEIQAILENPERAAGMASAALAQGRPDATQRLADLVEALGKTPAG